MFILGKYTYKSKLKLKEELKNILKNTPCGVIEHPFVRKILENLILLHPDYERKFGAFEISSFEIEKNHLGSGVGFVAILSNGCRERFSYHKCIDGRRASQRSLTVEAFRFITRSQMRQFRASLELPTVCTLSGRLIEKNEELEIDHKPEFYKVLSCFCKVHNLFLEDLKTQGNGEHLELQDKNIEEHFKIFHEKYAKLHPVHKIEHHK